ncbi:MAG: hypothetical protein QOE61_4405 [Micromonosporaceae bacterium]|nr:hypothetical protein [Micromonosporaceae bacterium]
MVFVNLDDVHDWHGSVVERAETVASGPTCILIGLAHRPLPPTSTRVLDALTCMLMAAGAMNGAPVPHTCVEVEDLDGAADALAASAGSAPFAALTLAGLLRVTAQLSVPDGLVAESLAYSMLLAGPEFRAWLARTPRRPIDKTDDQVLLDRDGTTLRIVLNRPHRNNAFGRLPPSKRPGRCQTTASNMRRSYQRRFANGSPASGCASSHSQAS